MPRDALAVATVVAAVAVVVSPLAVAAVALTRPRWYPVLDLAMTELRVRDVGGSHTPLIGLPGRIGRFPAQGSHPGPLSFYALAPVYRLLGSSSWALLVSALVVNAMAITTAVWLGWRRGGRVLALAVALVAAALVRGYGVEVLAEPWNPYLPLMSWVVVLIAVWSVACGDVVALPVAVVFGSQCAQTHVPYLGLVLGMGAVAVIAVVTVVGRVDRARALRWTAASVALGALLWAPVVVDQLVNDQGNLAMLWDHFTTPPEEPVGYGRGAELLLLHLDVPPFVRGLEADSGSLVKASSDPDGSLLPGAIVLALFAASAAAAWRMRNAPLVRLHAVVATGLALGAISMGRIFGKVWYYLMLWAWGIVALLVLAVVWTAVALAAHRLSPRSGGNREHSVFPIASRTAVAGLVALTVVASADSFRQAVDAEPPAPRLSAVLAEVMPPTAEALDPTDRYLVTWSDAFYIGSQGYGVVDELERRGFDVGVLDTWRVPVTHHRVLDVDEADARVHFATGMFVDEWRARPDATEVAYADPRTAAERREFERLRDRVVGELEDEGLGDLVHLVDGNLFGATLETRIPEAIRSRMERMLELGLPGAVFLTSPGADL